MKECDRSKRKKEGKIGKVGEKIQIKLQTAISAFIEIERRESRRERKNYEEMHICTQ